MLIKRPRGWEIAERDVTPERIYRDRRNFMAAAGLGAVGLAGALATVGSARAAWWWGGGDRIDYAPDPTDALYPVPRNDRYPWIAPITDELAATTYNNFYEFGSHKQIAKAAQALPIRPWDIAIDGLVEKPMTIGFDDLLKQVTLEERVYRHRCVEAWSMQLPWSGFPLRALVDIAKPLGSAKYVRFETFENREVAPGQAQSWYPWPYVEGLTMAEATHDLAFVATGAYGKPLRKQFGAPLRIHLPWKYGFKSIKSITRVSFVEERPVSFWEQIQASEYGFWANVNPKVPHPRWSQASERVLGSDERQPTKIYNGYGEFVADLYAGMDGERLFV